ncbi:MAG: hypothetical protein MJ052_01785 [Sphaerochaetaceae bacterium]|nr:hypothetical protein [Sphaerochaetaceae bacterium]
MKKLILIFIVFCLCFTLFAWQKTYRESSEEYQKLMLLKVMGDVNFPQMTTPITGSQMLNLLQKVERSRLPELGQKMYDELYSEFEAPAVIINAGKAGIDFKLEPGLSFLLNDPKNNDSLVRYKDKVPYFNGNVDLFITPYFFGKFNISLRPYSSGGTFSSISQAFPSWAYGSVGGKAVSFTVGRDRLSAGGGKTGNLEIGENALYHEFAKFGVVYHPFSYDLTLLAMDGFSKVDGKFPDNPSGLMFKDGSSAKKWGIMHRFSGTIKKRVTLSVFEGAFIYGTSPFSDITAWNPFMFIHNTGSYNTGCVNNFFGLEASSALTHGLNIDVQFILDQYQLKREKTGSEPPNAWGLLASLNGAWQVGQGILSAYAEGVWNSAGLYLKELNNSYDNKAEYGKYYMLDLVTGYNHFTEDEYQYLGYVHGADVRIAALGCEYRYGDYKFSADAMFRAKGIYGIGVNETRFLPASDNVHKSEYAFTIGVGAEAKFFNALTGIIGLSDTIYRNYRHVDGEKHNNFQLYLGVKVSALDFFVHRKKLAEELPKPSSQIQIHSSQSLVVQVSQ